MMDNLPFQDNEGQTPLHYGEFTGKGTHVIDTLYTSPTLIGTPILSNNSVLIREVSYGEREHYMQYQYLLARTYVLSRGVSTLESVP